MASMTDPPPERISAGELQGFEIVGNRAEYRPPGRLLLSEAALAVTAAIKRAKAIERDRLLVDLREIGGVSELPTLGTRYFIVLAWALAAGSDLAVAFIVPPQWIDPQRFGVKVATEHGANMNVFDSQESAVAWLKRVASC